jgi:hypothetical protein
LLWRPNLESGFPIPANEPGLLPDSPTPAPQPKPILDPSHTPSDTLVRLTYKGQSYHAVLQSDGGVRLPDGEIYAPSRAALEAAGLHCNGWQAWKYEAEPGQWQRIGKHPNIATMLESKKLYDRKKGA